MDFRHFQAGIAGTLFVLGLMCVFRWIGELVAAVSIMQVFLIKTIGRESDREKLEKLDLDSENRDADFNIEGIPRTELYFGALLMIIAVWVFPW